MKVDLHFHVRHKKVNWRDRLIEMIRAAEHSGIGCVVLLDHNKHAPQEWLDVAREISPSTMLLRGVELDVLDYGRDIKDHLVVVGDKPFEWDISRGVSTKDIGLLEKHAEADPNILIVLAHPFRKHSNVAFDFYDFLPDACEVKSHSVPRDFGHKYKIEEMARKWNLIMVATSDAHKPRHVGAGWIETKESPVDVAHLKRMVQKGEFLRSDQEQ